MTTTPYGINILGNFLPGDAREKTLDLIRRWHCAFVTITGDTNFDFANSIPSETKVIYRVYHPEDGAFWRMRQDDGSLLTAKEYVDYLAGLKRNHFYWQLLNEPGATGVDLDACLQWCIEAMEYAHSIGIHLCVGNFQVVKAELDTELKAGKWDKFLQICSKYRGWHLFGIHVYTAGIVQAGVLPLESLKDNEALKEDEWDKLAIIAQEGQGRDIGREWWFVHRCQLVLKIPPPDMAVTEGLWDAAYDRTSDFAHWIRGICGGEALGIGSLEKLWKYHYPSWTHGDAGARQFKWYVDTMPLAIKIVSLFCAGYDNGQWRTFNVLPFTPFIDRVAAIASIYQAPPIVAPPVPSNPLPVDFIMPETWFAARPKSGSIFLRSSQKIIPPSTQPNNILATIPSIDVLRISEIDWKQQREWIRAEWIRAEWDANQERVDVAFSLRYGWVNRDVVEVARVLEEAPETPPPAENARALLIAIRDTAHGLKLQAGNIEALAQQLLSE